MSIDSQQKISRVCDEIKNLLLTKNLAYGDSALDPVRFLSRSSPVEQILVRIDDKLNRIKQGSTLLGDDEDVVMDLIGYFVLLKIALDKEPFSDYTDRISLSELQEHEEISWTPATSDNFDPVDFAYKDYGTNHL